MRRFEAPQGGRNEFAYQGGLAHLLAPGPGYGHRARCPLLEQELCRLDQGMGVKTPRGQTIVDHVTQGNECHPLVVGHVCPDHGQPGPLLQPRRGVVESFIEPVDASGAGPLEAREVVQSRLGIHHGSQRGGIGGHHDVLE